MSGVLLRRLALCLLLCWSAAVGADSAVEARDFASEELRERYQRLSAELRCPKCSNQSLYESDAMIAADLRRELHRLLHEGLEDEAILDYMTERYGDFIRYRPRFAIDTAVLWLAPLLLAAAGLTGFLLWRRRNRNRHSSAAGAAAGVAAGAAPTVAPPSADGVPRRLRLRWLLPALTLAALVLYAAQTWRDWDDWRLGRAFSAAQPPDAASLERLEERHRRQPQNAEYALLLGVEYLRVRRYREAEAVLERARRLIPEDPRVRDLAQLAARIRAAVESAPPPTRDAAAIDTEAERPPDAPADEPDPAD